MFEELLNHWPLAVAVLVAFAAALFQIAIECVPNSLTLTSIIAAWFVAGMLSLGFGVPSAGGGLAASLLASFASLLLILPCYAALGLGAGCVKAQMAFGAWVGCGLNLRDALLIALAASMTAVAFTAVSALAWVAVRREGGLFPAQVTFSIGAIATVGYHFAIGIG